MLNIIQYLSRMLNIIFHQICIKYFSKKVISFKLHPLNTVIFFIILERPLSLDYYLSDRHQQHTRCMYVL